MNYLTDKCFLILYCMLGLIFTEVTPAFTAALLGAVAVSQLLYAFPSSRFCRILLSLYCAAALWAPEICFFLPLVSYDFFPGGKPECRDAGRQFTELLFFWLPGALAVFAVIFRLFSPAGMELRLLAFLLTGSLLAILLRYRTDSLEALRRTYLQTMDNDAEIQLLLKEKNQTLLEKQDQEIYTATLRERNRIAREIHDNVGHMLTRSILMVGALKTVNKEETLSAPLNQLEDTLNQAMNSIRRSVHDLHDSSVNLQESLEALTHEFTFCPVTFSYDISSEVPKEIKYSFISIVKEALVNIAKHSSGNLASVTLLEHPGFYQLVIWDNGDASSLSGEALLEETERNGIGLANIQNRVRALKGSLQIQTQPGFRIHITVPKT